VRQARAFTLLELLIALAVLAIVSMAIFTQAGNTIRQLQDLEQRTLARWVAENEVAKLHLTRLNDTEPVRTGTRRDLVSYGDRTWRVVEEIQATEHEWMHRVDVTVYAVEQGRELGPIDTLTAFTGRH